MSRAQILTLALLSMHLVLGMLCLAVARGERAAPALRLWGWGLIAFALGAALTLITALPFDARQVVGNSIIALSSLLSPMAVVHHTPWRFARIWLGGLFAAVVVGLIANHALRGGLTWDIGIPTLSATLNFSIAIAMLMRHAPASIRAAARFVALTLSLSIVVWLARWYSIDQLLAGTWERERADLAIALFAIGQLITLVAGTLGMIWIEVRLMGTHLERMALTDSLTGLPNRRAMRAQFDAEVARARREGGGFALLLFDADHFKRLNDQHGHLAGDAVLAWIALTLERTKRGADALGRIGGEEFLLLLPGLTRLDAVAAAERLRESVSTTALEHDGRTIQTTLSGGLALFPEDGEDWDRLFQAADRRLYRAKHAGRDRLVAADG